MQCIAVTPTAAGASAALGNSTAGHIISGTLGGIAGRAIGNRLRNRNTTIQPEQQQLLNGHRLGGLRSGRSRLNPEIQAKALIMSIMPSYG